MYILFVLFSTYVRYTSVGPLRETTYTDTRQPLTLYTRAVMHRTDIRYTLLLFLLRSRLSVYTFPHILFVMTGRLHQTQTDTTSENTIVTVIGRR